MSKLLPCPFCGGEARMWPSHTKTDKNGSYEIVGCSNIDCFIEPTTDEYLPYEEAIQRWNTRPAPAPCDELVTVGWLWEYAQYRTDDRGYYGYETVITENNPTDHVSPAEKLRNVRELVTRSQAEELLAAERERYDNLFTAWTESRERHLKAEADNKRLREALEPFAEYGEDHFDKDHNGNPLPDEQGVGWIYMNFGHFRKARAALGEVKP